MVKTRAMRVLLAAVVGVAGWCAGVGAAVGAPGDLDTSFSTDGIVLTDISGDEDDDAYGVVVDSQDRIVVAGYAWNDSNRDFAVVRYTSAGVLDAAFSSAFGAVDGMVITPICTYSDFGYAVALD